MYRNSYQHGIISIFFSKGSKPLEIWDTHIQDGYISRFLDDEIKSTVYEICGNNVSTTYMSCPKGKQVLGIFMPFMVMIVKNLKKYFTFEVTILDDTGTRRRFRASNFQSTTQVLPLSTAMPIGLNEGWNQIQFDLAKFTDKAYGRQFIEVQRVKINANIRIRRIYFTRRLIPDEELPADFKLFFPLASKGLKGTKTAAQKLEGQEERPLVAKEAAVISKVRLSQEEKIREALIQEPKISKENLPEMQIIKTPSNVEEVVDAPKEEVPISEETAVPEEKIPDEGPKETEPKETEGDAGSQVEIKDDENAENLTAATTPNPESVEPAAVDESTPNAPEE